MQLILIVLVIAVVAGFAAHGSLRPFEHLPIHVWGVALAGLGLQAIPLPSGAGRGLVTFVLIVSYALLIGFVWSNRRLPAVPLMLLGLVLNLAVVGLNGGMPVSGSAVRIAGGSVTTVPLAGTTSQKHHLMSDDDVLRPLADVIPSPPPLGDVLSVGDLFLYGGLACFVVLVMLGRSGENRRPPSRFFQMYRGKHLPRIRPLPRKTSDHPPQPAVPVAAGRSGTGP
jgi:Family of unknown function (DUF5317)